MAHPLSQEKNAREIGYDFLRMADSALKGIKYSDSKKLLKCSSHQAETRKSLFEELGFLYVPSGSDTIILTSVGQQLIDLLGTEPDFPSSHNLSFQVDKIICWSLLQVQINRPQSRGSPKPETADWQACDIKPYATFWKAVLDLNGYITLPEFFGAIRQLQKVSEYPSAIARIKEARKQGVELFDSNQYKNKAPLMNPRIYWNSHLSVGGNVLEFNQDTQSLILKENRRELISNLLNDNIKSSSDALNRIRAKPWADIHEYYSRFSKIESFGGLHTDIVQTLDIEIPKTPTTTKNIFVDAPIVKNKLQKSSPKKKIAKKYDYEKQDAENAVLGLKGEEYVVMIERLRLIEEGQNNLAESVCWVSKEQGDGLGYDIQSFQKNGDPLYIEVKTTNGGISSSFYLSENELEVARNMGDNYLLYRVFDFSSNPRIYKLSSPLEKYLVLEAISYRASVKPKNQTD